MCYAETHATLGPANKEINSRQVWGAGADRDGEGGSRWLLLFRGGVIRACGWEGVEGGGFEPGKRSDKLISRLRL